MEDDQDQFDQHFAEAAQKTEPAPAEQPASPEVQESPAEAQAPASQAPAAEAPAPTVPTIDELQARLADLQQRERSSAGRVSTFMRQNQELQQLVNDLRQRLDSLQAKPAPAAPAQAPVDDVLASAPDLEAAVKARVEAAVAPLMKRVEEASGKVEQVGRIATEARQTVEPIAQQRYRDAIAATHKGLDEQFTPAWREDVTSDRFSQWLDTQPEWVKKLHGSAITLEDSATVMSRYYVSNPRPKPVATAAPTAPAANQERLRQAAGVAPRGAPRPATGPAADDFDGHFALAARSLRTA